MAKRALTTLKRRPEFLRLRGGTRWACTAFVIEAKPRIDGGAGDRFGFTVTKALGDAVTRNRIRRRLKEGVVAAIVSLGADVGENNAARDHVVVARTEALTLPFDALVQMIATGLRRVHAAPAPAGDGKGRRGQGRSRT